MNRDELDKQITDAVTNAVQSNVHLLDVIAVLESAKMSLQIMMHESTRRAGLLEPGFMADIEKARRER